MKPKWWVLFITAGVFLLSLVLWAIFAKPFYPTEPLGNAEKDFFLTPIGHIYLARLEAKGSLLRLIWTIPDSPEIRAYLVNRQQVSQSVQSISVPKAHPNPSIGAEYDRAWISVPATEIETYHLLSPVRAELVSDGVVYRHPSPECHSDQRKVGLTVSLLVADGHLHPKHPYVFCDLQGYPYVFSGSIPQSVRLILDDRFCFDWDGRLVDPPDSLPNQHPPTPSAPKNPPPKNDPGHVFDH